MSTLLNTLRLCFLFSILQLTVTTVSSENVPPVVRLAEVLLHPRTNLHNRDVQTCFNDNQCSTANTELVAPCGTGAQIDAKFLECLCDATKKNPNFWSEFEQCETCLAKEGGTPDSGVDFSKEGPKLCEGLQGPPSTPTTTEDVNVTGTTREDVTVTETTTEDVTVTGTVEETATITDTTEETTTPETTEETTTPEATEETTTPETAGNQTTTTETTKKSPTTELPVVDKTTTLTTVDQTPEATVSRGNSSTTRTGTPTPSQESPESTDTGSGAIGSITTAQHGFQTAVWAFGIKLVVVAAFNFIL